MDINVDSIAHQIKAMSDQDLRRLVGCLASDYSDNQVSSMQAMERCFTSTPFNIEIRIRKGISIRGKNWGSL